MINHQASEDDPRLANDGAVRISKRMLIRLNVLWILHIGFCQSADVRTKLTRDNKKKLTQMNEVIGSAKARTCHRLMIIEVAPVPGERNNRKIGMLNPPHFRTPWAVTFCRHRSLMNLRLYICKQDQRMLIAQSANTYAITGQEKYHFFY